MKAKIKIKITKDDTIHYTETLISNNHFLTPRKYAYVTSPIKRKLMTEVPQGKVADYNVFYPNNGPSIQDFWDDFQNVLFVVSRK